MRALGLGTANVAPAKEESCRQQTGEEDLSGSRENNSVSYKAQLPRSAALHRFKLAAGINGVLPAYGGPLPFIPLLVLSRLRSALKE